LDALRCPCGKIVCQVKGQQVIIKCRGCKRVMVIIHTKGIARVEQQA